MSLNLSSVTHPLCVRNLSQCHYALSIYYLRFIILFSHEIFTIFYSHYEIIRFSKQFFLFLFARAFLVGLTVALLETNLDSWWYIRISNRCWRLASLDLWCSINQLAPSQSRPHKLYSACKISSCFLLFTCGLVLPLDQTYLHHRTRIQTLNFIFLFFRRFNCPKLPP